MIKGTGLNMVFVPLVTKSLVPMPHIITAQCTTIITKDALFVKEKGNAIR